MFVKISLLLFSAEPTMGGFKRGLDRQTLIDGENFRRNLNNTNEIKLCSSQLVPPTKKLMKGFALQNEDSTAMFCRPGKRISPSLAYVINCLFTVRKRSLRRLCFYTCLSFCPHGGVSSPIPRGEVERSGWGGVYRPRPRGVYPSMH